MVDTQLVTIAAVAAGAGIVGALIGASLAAPAPTQARPKRAKCLMVKTDKASPAGGHYSQAIVNGGEVFVSGLLPITRTGEKLVDSSFEAQCQQVLDNLDAILSASGTDMAHLISVRVYIANIDNWPAFDKMYTQVVGAHKPARAVELFEAIN